MKLKKQNVLCVLTFSWYPKKEPVAHRNFFEFSALKPLIASAMFGEIIIIIIIIFIFYGGVRVWEFSLKNPVLYHNNVVIPFHIKFAFLYTCIYHKCNNVREGIWCFILYVCVGFVFCLFVCFFFFTT